MSLLYPRLMSSAAHELYGALRGRDVEELRRDSTVIHPSAVFAATGGVRVTPKRLAELAEEVREVASTYGYPFPVATARVAAFDSAVAKVLHARADLVPSEAAVRSLWAFLGLVVLPDVSVWRFPGLNRDRFLATDITRHALGRLWWRAELLWDEQSSEPYDLVDAFGEAAFDQVFARRRSIGGSRDLVRVLARHYKTVRSPEGVPDRLLLQDVLKRLLRLGSILELDALDESQLLSLVEELVAASLAALTGPPGGAGPG